MLKTEPNQPFSRLQHSAIGESLFIQQEIGAMLRGWQMINHLHQAELDEYQQSSFSAEILPVTAEDVVFRNAFQTHVLCRLTSYIVTICTLDGILNTSYSNLLGLTQSASDSGPDSKSEIHARQVEIEHHQWYRNKVFAHTSFSQPTYGGKTDSESLQRSSLIYFSGELLLAKPKIGKQVSFALGGGGWCSHGNSPKAPTLSILEDRENILTHYQTWENMFLTVLNKRQSPAGQPDLTID